MLGNRREMLAKIVMGNNVDNSVGNEQKEMRKIKENRLYGTGKWREPKDDDVPPLIRMESISSPIRSLVGSLVQSDLAKEEADTKGQSVNTAAANISLNNIFTEPTYRHSSTNGNRSLPMTNSVLFKQPESNPNPNPNLNLNPHPSFQHNSTPTPTPIYLFTSLVHYLHNPPSSSPSPPPSLSWLNTPSSFELLTSLMTKPDRLQYYISSLLQHIVELRKKHHFDIIAQLEHIDQTKIEDNYRLLMCLLSKIEGMKNRVWEQQNEKNGINRDTEIMEGRRQRSVVRTNPKQENISGTVIYVSEEGLKIEIDPYLTQQKHNNDKTLTQLRQKLHNKIKELNELKETYNTIIENYAITMDNIMKRREENKVDTEKEIGKIRDKNHTFGGEDTNVVDYWHMADKEWE